MSPTPTVCSRSSSVFSLARWLARSRSLSRSPRSPLSPTRFFLLSSEERASPPKTKEKQQRTHAPRNGGRGRGDGGHKLSQTITISRRHKALTAPRLRSLLPAARDHERPLNNRAMRRRPVTLSYLALPLPIHTRTHSTQPLLISLCVRWTLSHARAHANAMCERLLSFAAKTDSNTRLVRARLQAYVLSLLSGAIFAVRVLLHGVFSPLSRRARASLRRFSSAPPTVRAHFCFFSRIFRCKTIFRGARDRSKTDATRNRERERRRERLTTINSPA